MKRSRAEDPPLDAYDQENGGTEVRGYSGRVMQRDRGGKFKSMRGRNSSGSVIRPWHEGIACFGGTAAQLHGADKSRERTIIKSGRCSSVENSRSAQSTDK